LNEEEVIPELDKRLRALLDAVGVTWEVVFIDDGSTDRSRDLILALAEKEPRYKLVGLSRNFGHQIAMTAGLDHAEGEAVVVMDADLQDPPDLVNEMLARWREGYDVVYAVRERREGESLFKRFTAAVFYRTLRFMVGLDIPVDTGDFRLQSRRVVLALRAMRETHRFVRGFVVWVGFKQTAVRFVRPGRFAGTTKYPLRKMFRFAIDGITAFSIVPLHLASLLSFISFVVAIGISAWAGWERFFGTGVVPGWTSTVLAISLSSAGQFLLIGILGEYVGRIYQEVKNRPIYVVGELKNLTTPEDAGGRTARAVLPPRADAPRRESNDREHGHRDPADVAQADGG
jgi:dolichol-phosphate mannosyltransferase